MVSLLGVAVAMMAGAQGSEAYLFAHMVEGDYGRLYYSVSLDGRHWMFLNDGKRVHEAYHGHPDICRGHDGRYYLIGNRASVEAIDIWGSEDLIHWERHGEFMPELEKTEGFKAGFFYAGAPKMYYDEPSATYLMTWHTPSEKNVPEEPASMWDSMRTLYVTSKDLQTFSIPKRLFDFEMATIDVIVRRIEGKYYAFLKDERGPSFEVPTGKTIRVSVSESLLGPYGAPSAPISPNWREAPTVIPRPGGDGWFMYCERYPGISYDGFTAPHPTGPWYGLHAHDARTPPQARHGCMIPISRAQYDALCTAFPNAAKGAE